MKKTVRHVRTANVNAGPKLTVRPAMDSKELADAGSGIEKAVKGYGKAATA
jgi:hypothetical protein